MAPRLPVSLGACVMINSSSWAIVRSGLDWLEQDDTDSCIGHLRITSVYPETINEGEIKLIPKYAKIFE